MESTDGSRRRAKSGKNQKKNPSNRPLVENISSLRARTLNNVDLGGLTNEVVHFQDQKARTVVAVNNTPDKKIVNKDVYKLRFNVRWGHCRYSNSFIHKLHVDIATSLFGF